jgi:hypothetical protein
MTREEYNILFHKEQLNLVAFKRLLDCDEEVLRLVNRAVQEERETCAKMCDYVYDNIVTDEHIKAMAFKIRARGQG